MENAENEVETPEVKQKSNLLNYIALAIVIFFAGYYILNAGGTDDSDDNDDSIEFVEETEELPDGKGGTEGLITAGQFGEAGGVNSWKNAGDSFTFSAKSEWEVHQIDAGPVSIVEAYHPDNASESVTLWLQDANMEFEDIQITFNDWLLGSTQNMTEVKECGPKDLGGLTMTCRMGYIGDEYWLMYFGELNESVFTGVFKPVDNGREEELMEVIESISFNPSEAEIESAILIP